MGQMKPNGSGTQSVVRGKPVSSLLGGLGTKKKEASPSWGDVDTKVLVNVIEAATEIGALVSLSKTSDGGALRLYVKHDRDVLNEYSHSIDEMDELLAALESRLRE